MKKKFVLYVLAFFTLFFINIKVSAYSINSANSENLSILSSTLILNENHFSKFAIPIAEVNTTLKCDTIFGSYNNKQDPAYYIHFAFDLIKYAAIAILVVTTIMNYVSAIASSNDDALKKANKNFIKRLILCIAIFFLPSLIEFLLKALGLVTDPLCGTI